MVEYAFPCPASLIDETEGLRNIIYPYAPGMTLLDFFAAASLAGYRASGAVLTQAQAANKAYNDAEKMMAERLTRQP